MTPSEAGEPIESYEDIVGLTLNLERAWNRQVMAAVKAKESEGWSSIPDAFYDALAVFAAEGESRCIEDAQSRALSMVQRSSSQ